MQLAQERLDDLELWCRNVAANLEAMTYEGKRRALHALGVEVRVWRSDHSPRWEVKARAPILTACS